MEIVQVRPFAPVVQALLPADTFVTVVASASVCDVSLAAYVVTTTPCVEDDTNSRRLLASAGGFGMTSCMRTLP